jgi:hypothetical protein
MARTEREQIRCTVKEDGEGRPFLFFEPMRGEPMASFPNTHFGLDLTPGTTYAEARKIADLLDRHVATHFALIFDENE